MRAFGFCTLLVGVESAGRMVISFEIGAIAETVLVTIR